ncbi:unnamed protein product [Cuscuta epithymum]|uniref:Retrotransposon Copia-like N-terminal domain-containing protein n=1 Tax=Cuscuta epithymum TaxID=186058 RepID=A0AAV0DHM2_9ASTE|nr:unnamed protein product [Cuscuta epithymum]
MAVDITSSYYLGSGDQPGNLITHIIFRGDNYVAWSRAILLSLKARRKHVFVDGTLTKPAEEAQRSNWETTNSMVVSWLLRSMEPTVVVSIPFHEEARALWVYLEKRYSVANGPRLQQLKASISACKQTKTMTVDAYYTALMSLYDELDRLKPLPACSCGRCTCDVVGKIVTERAEERFHQFLIGIDDEIFGTVRSNLLAQNPLPDIDRALQAFQQEENSRAIARGKQSVAEVHAFALQPDRAPKGRQDKDKTERPRPVCTHCRKKGHEIDSCFKLHGYPDWWEEKHRPKGASGSSANRGGAVRTHAMNSNLQSAGEGASSSQNLGVPVLPPLTTEQVQAILSVLNMDSRSSDRMSGPTLEEPDWSR